MEDERRSERRSLTERRLTPGRRVREEEWLPLQGTRQFDTSDRRGGERRGLDRRKPID